MFAYLVMVALCNRADHYMFALWFLSSFFFFPRLISAVGDWMFRMMPEMCCTRLAENTGCKKIAIAQLFRAVSSQLRHVSTIGKKLVKHRYLLHMSS